MTVVLFTCRCQEAVTPSVSVCDVYVLTPVFGNKQSSSVPGSCTFQQLLPFCLLLKAIFLRRFRRHLVGLPTGVPLGEVTGVGSLRKAKYMRSLLGSQNSWFDTFKSYLLRAKPNRLKLQLIWEINQTSKQYCIS